MSVLAQCAMVVMAREARRTSSKNSCMLFKKSSKKGGQGLCDTHRSVSRWLRRQCVRGPPSLTYHRWRQPRQ